MELSPYFKAIARVPHACPECHHRLRLIPLELTWDGAIWKCDNCKWFYVELAPENAKMGQRDAQPEPPKRTGRIIAVDFGGGRS